MAHRTTFITGGKGFMGRSLIAEALKRGHKACALLSAIENPPDGIKILTVPRITTTVKA